MPDEPQNPISEENSIPVSSQEPMADIPVSAMDSTTTNIPLEASESPKNVDIPVSLNNDNSENTPNFAQITNETKPVENNKTEEISELAQTSEAGTAQILVNEPFTLEPEVKSEPLKPEPETSSQSKTSLARELLIKARNMIQFRKRKKLDKIMTLFLKHSKISNDEVEKFLHVSDATAERYLNILEKENRIKQNGKTGHMVSYSRI